MELTLEQIYKVYALRCAEMTDLPKLNSEHYKKMTIMRDLLFIASYWNMYKEKLSNCEILKEFDEIEERLMNL